MFFSSRVVHALILVATVVAFNAGLLCTLSIGACPNDEGQNGLLIPSSLCRQTGAGFCTGCAPSETAFSDVTSYNNNWINVADQDPEVPNPSAATLVTCYTLADCAPVYVARKCNAAKTFCDGTIFFTCYQSSLGAPVPVEFPDFEYCD